MKECFDPFIHTADRDRLIAYIEKVHGGNYTAAAYHLGTLHTVLSRIIKGWKVIPQWLIAKLDDAPKENPNVIAKVITTKVDEDLSKEFQAEYDRISKLTEFRTSAETAAKIGITAESLVALFKGEAPVTDEIISRMQAVV